MAPLANPQEIYRIIEKSVVNIEVSGLTTDSSLRDLGMDSMDKMNLLLSLEQEFGIKISDNDAAGLDSIDSIVAFINSSGQLSA